MNLRHGRHIVAAAALLTAAVLTTACSTQLAGTGSAAATGSSAPTAITTPAGPSAPATVTSTVTVSETSDHTDAPTLTVVVEPSGLDATTAAWLQNSCTDVGTLFGALFALPAVDETAPLEEFRVAYRDYYAALADTVLGMTERMAPLDPPTVEGGQALHDGYLTYLITLADITASGSIAIDEAVDAESVAAIVDQIDFEIERLGESDLGLADFQGQELQALMAEVPECQDLLAT